MSVAYEKKIVRILLRDPLKLKGMWRLKTGGEHKRGKYYLRKDGFSAPPITIAIRLTYQCNLRCLACGQWGEHGTFIRSSPETLPKDGL
ncbi:MAG: hypothetical protein KGJ11_08775, partial [Candidatus Omnitrophica bacterium]|nr:hypothetical protein [Candidatus Omnitrophota bacterium]